MAPVIDLPVTNVRTDWGAAVQFAKLPPFPYPVVVAADRPIDQLVPILAAVPACGVIAQDSEFPFGKRSWKVPGGTDTLLLLEPQQRLCLTMLCQAYAKGIRWLVLPWATEWRRRHLGVLILLQITGKMGHLADRRFSRWVAMQRSADRLGRLARLFSFPREVRLRRMLARAPVPDADAGRVLVVTDNLAAGGGERLAVNTLRALRDAGVNADLFCRSLDSRQGHNFYLSTVRDGGIEPYSAEQFIGLPVSLSDRALTSPVPARLLPDVLLYLAVFRALRPQAIHIWQDFTCVAAGLAGVLAGVPRVLLNGVSLAPCHFPFYVRELGGAYRALARRPEVRLVNNSLAGAMDYERWLGVGRGTVGVLYNGIADPSSMCSPEAGRDFRRQWGLAEDAPVVGVVQRMDPIKDPDLWLQTAAQVLARLSAVRFVLIGGGPVLEPMKAAAATLGLADHMTFTGPIAAPWAAYQAMDVFLLTSRQEGLPNVIVEAQMMGVRVVAADVGGVAEAVSPETGRLVDERSPDLFADAIVDLLSDGGAERAKECGRQWALARFGLDRMVSTVLAAYGIERE